jgi:amino acid permease
MRQIELPPDIAGHGPQMGSRDWVPRNTIARIGAFFFGSFFVVGGLVMVASSYLLKEELRHSISSPPTAFLVGLVAVAMVVSVAFFVIFYGGRLVMSSVRRPLNGSSKT